MSSRSHVVKTGKESALESLVNEFLEGMSTSNRSPHTRRAYASDLLAFSKANPELSIEDVTSENVASFLTTFNQLSPATRARKQVVLSSFFNWAVKREYLANNPVARLDRVKLPTALPRGVERKQIEAVFAMIPPAKLRDKVLFRLIFETGLRVSEALNLHVEDLDLRKDDEHITVLGKGQKRRTLLLDDRSLVILLRKYLKETNYKHGPLFRAEKNGTGGPIRYQSVQELWQSYCQKAGKSITLHQLRHTHATELINGGVSLNTIKKRLGHANLQTTLRYAEQSDATADAELRTWRRKHSS